MASLHKLNASWRLVTQNERISRSSQAVSVIGDRAFVFGGELIARQPVDNRVDVVNLANTNDDSSETLATPSKAPSPRVGSPSTAIGADMYLFSGRGGLEMKPIEEKGAVWCYKATENEWVAITPTDNNAPFPSGRSYHCITSDGVDKLYLHSGCPEQGRLGDLWVFDVIKRSWTELPAAPDPSRGGSSIAFLNGRLYRMNGFDGNVEQGGALDIYDIEARSWSTISYTPDGIQGPEARSVSTLVPLSIQNNSYLLTMFGERDPSSLGHAGAGKMLSDVWVFDTETNLWLKIETRNGPVARGWFDADVVKAEDAKGAVVVHGGLGEDNERLGDVWCLQFFT
ncbi:hypothetical protein FPSE_03256 [Fusarium pseudograminearum CS3096]|uniref:Kelch repeat protein n=1 Tax=Fusarium pseudograminearum (strain CS3096) TaxID=1028729 RepID=K3W1W1_FUSPC|nr:hypothetical protein FPSE_03256 [Fusarium pseudograminearum CS3096]EKJ76590.1 hypothetical protein FPSE_03256 [Fusarium pseudograminearum CS3096]KAF0637287.1 hypothetical protein FPSE5266_03256 [Fusarium pseudograminearum]